MKYYLVAVDPVNHGLNEKNTKLCKEDSIPIMLEILASEYPNETLVVLRPINMYKTKAHVEMTKFKITDKLEIIPE